MPVNYKLFVQTKNRKNWWKHQILVSCCFWEFAENQLFPLAKCFDPVEKRPEKLNTNVFCSSLYQSDLLQNDKWNKVSVHENKFETFSLVYVKPHYLREKKLKEITKKTPPNQKSYQSKERKSVYLKTWTHSSMTFCSDSLSLLTQTVFRLKLSGFLSKDRCTTKSVFYFEKPSMKTEDFLFLLLLVQTGFCFFKLWRLNRLKLFSWSFNLKI